MSARRVGNNNRVRRIGRGHGNGVCRAPSSQRRRSRYNFASCLDPDYPADAVGPDHPLRRRQRALVAPHSSRVTAASKPLLPFPAADSSGTLLAQPSRAPPGCPTSPGSVDNRSPVRDCSSKTRDAYAASRVRPAPRVAYLLEPYARNTAPAVALGALYAEAVFGRDATLLVLPADRLLRDTMRSRPLSRARQRKRAPARSRRSDHHTTAAETGYGYLELGGSEGRTGASGVRRLHREPPVPDATRYADRYRRLWNSGMFCCTTAGALCGISPDARRVYSMRRAHVWRPLIAHQDDAVLESMQHSSPPRRRSHSTSPLWSMERRSPWCGVSSAGATLAPGPPSGRTSSNPTQWAIAARVSSRRSPRADAYVHAADRIVAAVDVDGLFIVDTPDAAAGRPSI